MRYADYANAYKELYPDADKDEISEGYKLANEDVSPMALTGKGLQAGYHNMLGSFGSLGEMVGLDTGDFAQEQYKQAEQFQLPEHLRGSIVDNPDLLSSPQWWGHSLGQIAPSLATSLVPGGVVAKGASMLPKLAPYAAALGSGTSAFTGGAIEAGGFYNETKDPALSTLYGAGVAGMSYLPFSAMLGGGKFKSLPGRMLAAGGGEAVQEWAEEPYGAMLKGEDIMQAAKEGVNVMPASFVAGMLGAGGVKATGKAIKATQKSFKEAADYYQETGTLPTGMMVAGVKAGTADMTTLEEAQKQVESGKEMNEVFKDTGWYLGPDGEWRFEINDQEAEVYQHVFNQINAGIVDTSEGIPLGQILEHEKLFNAYPELSGYEVFVESDKAAGGSFNPETKQINIYSKGRAKKDQFKSTLLHEIQHGIQTVENFARGGSSAEFKNQVRKEVNQADEVISKLNLEMHKNVQAADKIKADRSAAWSDPEKVKLYDEMLDNLSKRYRQLMDRRSEFIETAQQDVYEEPFKRYQNLAGEIEARDTEARMNLTDEQRRTTEPQLLKDADKAIIKRQAFKEAESRTGDSNFANWFGDSKVVDEAGAPQIMYHGTTHDFDTFSPEKGNPENDFGVGYYFTNTPEDVSENYAGEGPDLTSRIQRHAELLHNEFYDQPDAPMWDRVDELLGTRDMTTVSSEDYDTALEQIAREELSGGQPNVMPVYVSLKNPAILGGQNETIIEGNEYTEDGDINESEDFENLYEAIQDAANLFDDTDAQTLWEDVSMAIAEGEDISLADVVSAIKESEGAMYAADPAGDLASGELIRKVLEYMGYDGIIDNTVNEKFGTGRVMGQSMAGVDYDTQHVIAFKPEQIKSAIGNKGTFDPNNPNIMESREVPRGTDGIESRNGDLLYKNVPLKSLQIDRIAIDENGQQSVVKEQADIALKEIDDHIETVRKVIECQNS